MRGVDPLLPWRAGSAIARALPEPVVVALAAIIGRGVAAWPSDRRRMLERHLRRVVGPGASDEEIRRLVRRAFASYARYWVETFRVPALSLEVLDARLSINGRAHIEDALAAGNGVILALPHLGGWELGGAYLTRTGNPTTVVVEPLEPPEVFEWFVDLRRAMGMEIVAVGPDAGRAAVRALRANHTLCLLCDRDVSGSGIDVEFFGERTTLPGGPATLALRTGAPLLPAAVYFEGRRGDHRGIVQPPIDATRSGSLRNDIARMTQDLAHELEVLIRAAPDQWHLLQPNWPSDRA